MQHLRANICCVFGETFIYHLWAIFYKMTSKTESIHKLSQTYETLGVILATSIPHSQVQIYVTSQIQDTYGCQMSQVFGMYHGIFVRVDNALHRRVDVVLTQKQRSLLRPSQPFHSQRTAADPIIIVGQPLSIKWRQRKRARGAQSKKFFVAGEGERDRDTMVKSRDSYLGNHMIGYMDFGSVYFGHLGLVCINSAVDLFWIGLLYREKRAMHAGRPAGFTVVVVKQLSAAMEYADGPATRRSGTRAGTRNRSRKVG